MACIALNLVTGEPNRQIPPTDRESCVLIDTGVATNLKPWPRSRCLWTRAMKAHFKVSEVRCGRLNIEGRPTRPDAPCVAVSQRCAVVDQEENFLQSLLRVSCGSVGIRQSASPSMSSGMSSGDPMPGPVAPSVLRRARSEKSMAIAERLRADLSTQSHE